MTKIPSLNRAEAEFFRQMEEIATSVMASLDEFADLVRETRLPQERQDTCETDYSNASWSWETVLKPHLRAPDQPKQKIKVTYGPPGEYVPIAQAFKTIGMMEMLADYAANRFVWRRPITFDVQACGQPDLHWDLSLQKIIVCYEIVQDFANLYRGYGLTYALAPQPAKDGKVNKK